MYVDGEVYANFNTHQAAVELFSDPLFVTLTSCVMQRAPVIKADVLPQQFVVDYVKVYEWVGGGEWADSSDGATTDRG